jgi:phage tail sheath protein FI
MIENDRGDALYVMTTPDTNNGVKLTTDEAVSIIDNAYDSNYSCTYWPWLQINDSETNHYIWIPPTRDVIANIAFNDKNSFPWFATAGVTRGRVGSDVVQVRKTLTLAERDTLYENRINPMAKFTTEGIVIWGNKTLQIKDTALNRINVRRLLLQARKLVSAVGIKLLFEQNDSAVRNQFLSQVNPILENIRVNRGLTDFRVVVSNSPEDYDRNQLTGQIFLKPTRSLEFVQLEFVITNTSASFNG